MTLTEEQILIRDSTRAFAQERLAPGAAARDREKSFPHAEIVAMGELGLLGMLVPETWGGADAGFLAYALAMEEIAAADGSCAGIMSIQNGLVCRNLVVHGSEAQKERWLADCASGRVIGAFALTEAEAGSDAAAIRTRARRDGDDYVIDGAKAFITNASVAGLAIVFAKTDPEAGRRGISAFLVPTDSPGFAVTRIESKLGQHASDTCQLAFDNLRVPSDALLGEEGAGYKIALSALEGGRIAIGAQALGLARAAYETALDYAKERQVFGKAIIEHQVPSFRFADMATQLKASRLLVHHAAELKDAGQPCLKEASMAKLSASEMAERVCSNAMQVFGGYGYLEDFPLSRYLRDVRVCQIYEGSSDIQRLLIAREIARD